MTTIDPVVSSSMLRNQTTRQRSAAKILLCLHIDHHSRRYPCRLMRLSHSVAFLNPIANLCHSIDASKSKNCKANTCASTHNLLILRTLPSSMAYRTASARHHRKRNRRNWLSNQSASGSRRNVIKSYHNLMSSSAYSRTSKI